MNRPLPANVLRAKAGTPAALAAMCRAGGLPEPDLEWRLYPDDVLPGRRKRVPFRFDAAWPAYWLAVEVQGGAFIRGGHTRGAGFRRDQEKLCEAVAQGWACFGVLPEWVASGRAALYVERALMKRGWRRS